MANDFLELLKPWSLLLLCQRIVLVEELEELLQRLLFPLHLLVDSHLLDGIIHLAPLLALQEEEVYLAIVVGQAALAGVAEQTAHDSQSPYPEAPLWHQTDADADIDGDEPQVAGSTVEDTSQRTFLIGESRQLSITTVVHIRPYEQQNAHDIDFQIVETEADTRSHTQEDGEDGYYIRRNVQHSEKSRPLIAYRAIEINVNMLLGVCRLQRSLIFLICHFFLNYYTCLYMITIPIIYIIAIPIYIL